MPSTNSDQQNPLTTTTDQPVSSLPTFPDPTDSSLVSGNGSAAPSVSFPDLKVDEPRKKFGGGKGKIVATILGIMLLVGGIGTGAYLALQNQNPQEKAAIIGEVCTPGTTTSCTINNCPGTKLCNSMGSGWSSCTDKSGDNCPASGGGGGGGGGGGTTLTPCPTGNGTCTTSVLANGINCSNNGASNYCCVAPNPYLIGSACSPYPACQLGASCTLTATIGLPACSTGNANQPVSYCCPLGLKLVGDKCVSTTLPTCQSGLKCAQYNLNGGDQCISSSGENAWCCPSGSSIMNGVCVPNCGTGLFCDMNIPATGSTRCIGGDNNPTWCCPSGQYLNKDLKVCTSSDSTVPDPNGPIGCPVAFGTKGSYSLPSSCTKVTEPGKAPTCVNNQRCTYTRDEARCSVGKNPDGSDIYKWCFLYLWEDCKPYQCSATTPPVTPTVPPVVTAQCQNIKAYSSAWTELSSIQLSALKSGSSINFCVVGSASAGSFDKAKFTINGAAQAETTTQRPNTQDYCQIYTIPAGTYSFDVTAQIHHVTLGWK